jgi:hypothetical protein
MSLHQRWLAWIRRAVFPTRPASVSSTESTACWGEQLEADGGPLRPAPRWMPAGRLEEDAAAAGQELTESRERILSRLTAWRMEQCRQELQLSGCKMAATLIPFPAIRPPSH